MKSRIIIIALLGGLILAACSGVDSVKPTTAVPPRTFVFECGDGYRFPARIEGETAWLFLPGQSVRLTHVPAASGVKYTAENMTFWQKGEAVLLETDSGIRRSCRNNRALAIWEHAKLNGVDFRAFGNEPGWHLEISRGRKTLFVTNYGQSRYAFETPEPVSDAKVRASTYRGGNSEHTLEVVISGQPCRDTMRGDAFESTVTVTLDGKRYHGCGRALH